MPDVDSTAKHRQRLPDSPEGIRIFPACKPANGWLEQVEGKSGNRGEDK